jgi:hypothetical protein
VTDTIDLSAPVLREVGTGSGSWTTSRVSLGVGYVLLGTALVVSRLAGLGHGYWLDEAIFVEHYVREGPREILTGPSLSHELYAIVDWATASLVGESAVAFRLWSAVTFILGVALVTVWLHKRRDPIAGLLFLFFATASPLLLDISRQARGYGFAFLAMAVVVVAALEARGSGSTLAIASMCVAGVIGAWTLPQLAIAFIATAASLVVDPGLRRRVAIGIAVSVFAIVIWFVPHLLQVYDVSQDESAGPSVTAGWLLTAPFDQLLIPALVWIDGVSLKGSAEWLPFTLAALLIMGSSPLLRTRDKATLIVCTGPIATFLAFWVAGAHTAPRFVSFLLVQLFILAGTGGAAILRGIPKRRAPVRAVLLSLVLGALALHFLLLVPDVVRHPREANEKAAEFIETRAAPGTTVVALVRDPQGLEFYLDQPFETVTSQEVASRVCTSDRPVAYVMQPWAVGNAVVPCLVRDGVEHGRFEQYSRGRMIEVWLVPPGG